MDGEQDGTVNKQRCERHIVQKAQEISKSIAYSMKEVAMNKQDEKSKKKKKQKKDNKLYTSKQ